MSEKPVSPSTSSRLLRRQRNLNYLLFDLGVERGR
jgi:hypothetical protein